MVITCDFPTEGIYMCTTRVRKFSVGVQLGGGGSCVLICENYARCFCKL